MNERDLIMMSCLIFLPTVFALVLCLPGVFGKGKEELVRWVALWGTGITMVLSFWVFIDFFTMVDHHRENTTPGRSSQLLLSTRADNALARDIVGAPRDSADWVGRIDWIPSLNIEYFVGLDGISMALILLTTVVTFLSMLASWNINKHVRGYCILFLLLETGMIGTFLALDFFLFYIFWEVMLLPMYFLIGVWGGPRREYAAIKFFLYTLLGSVFILIALLGFYFTDVSKFVSPEVAREAVQIMKKDNPTKSDAEIAAAVQQKIATRYRNSFDLTVLATTGATASEIIKGKDPANLLLTAEQRKDAALVAGVKEAAQQSFFTPGFQYTMFLLLLIGFAIKVPVFPFHTWLPDAHVEAPTPISMILAGVLLKMGGYGIIRIAYPICPWAAEMLATWVCAFAMVNIVYGAFAAMAQTDFKKLVAYSSVSHMGYVLLGIAVWSGANNGAYWAMGLNGAMYQMIAHGITSPGMFFLVGVIYDRAHHRNLDNFRGLNEPMPLYGGVSAIIFFAAMGLPGLCGFVGEVMTILATWNFSPPDFPNAGKVFAVLSALTVVLTAAYVLWTIQRVFLGENAAYKDYKDMTPREVLTIVPLLVLSVVLGVLPNLILSWMGPSVTGLVNSLLR